MSPPSDCRPFIANRLVRTPLASYYPDVLVVCGPAADRLYETDATLVVEVLSDSTELFDRGKKFKDYQRLPSLRHYLLVNQDDARIRYHEQVRAAFRDFLAARPALQRQITEVYNRTYRGFIALVKWSTIAMIVLLVGMAVTLL